jgi:hypothetical protein
MTRRDLWVALAAGAVASVISTTVLALQQQPPQSQRTWDIVCEPVANGWLENQVGELSRLGREAGANGYQLVQVLTDSTSYGSHAKGICFQRPR